MVCKRCGAYNVDNASFCSSCGNSLEQIPVYTTDKTSKKTVDKKKIIIISLLIVIIIMLSIFLIILKSRKNNRYLPDDNATSRTIMIYLVGSDLESENGIATSDLAGIKESEIDFNNMNILLYTGGTQQWHNFISNDENAIYELTTSGFVKKESYSQEDMGDADTLSTLLNYAYDNYVTDAYDLILYDHGGAIDGAIYDDFTNDHLTIAEMGDALDNSSFKGSNKLETIIFRTCLNGTVELANELADYSNYLIASEEITHGAAGSSVLSFLNYIETDDTAIDYGKKFISEYEYQINEIDPLGVATAPMYSIIDLNKIDDVVSELDEFISGIDLSENYADIIRIRGSLYQYAYSFYNQEAYDMVDLYSLIDNITQYSSVSSDDLLAAIDEAVVYNWSEMVEESHGLSIYFPYKGGTLTQNKFLSVYNDLDFSESYVTFIKQISNLVKSNNASNFSKNDITTNNNVITKGEFVLELTPEQAADFAEASYVVFEKQEDGLFMPIYSSDNAYLDGTKVRSNVTNNLLQIVDHSDESRAWVQLYENGKTGVKSYKTFAVAFHFGEGDGLDEFDVSALTLYIDYDDNNKPYIAKASKNSTSEDGISTVFVDLDYYEYIQFTNYRYGILDEAGNYNPDWESSDIKYLFEVSTDSDYELVNVSLDDGDYYAAFTITDIYGNRFYSNLVSVNK